MSYGWIDAKQFSFNTLLLMDRWIFCTIAKNQRQEFRRRLGIALAGNPAILWYIVNKCPEQAGYYRALIQDASEDYSNDEVRDCEVYVLDALDWAVVYVYPEIMDTLGYITEWDSERLLSITDFTNKTVLDIGSGTGRLAIAAATVAKTVYASEPVDRLREYMREKVKRLDLNKVYVIDGKIESIPFQDEFFDIVMSGHTFGDDYEVELREMMRVTKPGGYIIDCPGEDDRKRPEGPDKEPLKLGFQYLYYTSKLGGDVYRYWKQKS
ncbi:MAG: class I SAM-dependent methyltransferase [Dehalococcoidales bacterium]|nr:MAG: class I SAM-dependent methyltransferase [Dehalococcoidales bacterium]